MKFFEPVDVDGIGDGTEDQPVSSSQGHGKLRMFLANAKDCISIPLLHPCGNLRKIAPLEEEYEKTLTEPLSVLKLRVKQRIKSYQETKNMMVDVKMSSVTCSRALKSLREKSRPVVTEASELLMMVSDPAFQYCRRFKVVGSDFVVTLGHDKLLKKAYRSWCFAGNATYKTVTERDGRTIKQGRWYLYKILISSVAGENNVRSIVVYRVLFTSLSEAVYKENLKFLFMDMLEVGNTITTTVTGKSCLAVPYIAIPPSMRLKACLIRAITMEFDVAEVHGCAKAVV